MAEREWVGWELHFAALHGDLSEVARLLATGADPNEFDEIGKTPLHYASEGGHHAVRKALIAAGANVNAHDEKTISNTVLAEIAGECSLKTAAILIQAGPTRGSAAGCN